MKSLTHARSPAPMSSSSSLPRSRATEAGSFSELAGPRTSRGPRCADCPSPDDLVSMFWMPADFDDRAHRATGDDAGAVRRRLQQHAARAEVDRAPRAAAWCRRAARCTSAFFADSMPFLIADGTSLALPIAEPDVAVPVADDDQRAEAQVLAALDDLGDAVDGDHRVLQVELRAGSIFCLRLYIWLSAISSRQSAVRAAVSAARRAGTRPRTPGPPRAPRQPPPSRGRGRGIRRGRRPRA